MNESVENTENVELDLTETPVEAPKNAKEAYESLEEKLAAIPEKELVAPKQPLHVVSTEATEIALAAQHDRDTLISFGADADQIDSMSDRASAFSYAAANYQVSMGADPTFKKMFTELSPQGYEVKHYLERFYGHVFRRDKDVLAKLEEITEGRGHSDMVFDLLPLHMLGEANPGPLKAMRAFKWERVKEAQDLHNKLRVVYAQSNIDPNEIDRAKDMLDRAYTYLKQAMDEIKEIGQFAFEGTDRYQAYVSEFYRQAALAAARARRARAQEDGATAM